MDHGELARRAVVVELKLDPIIVEILKRSLVTLRHVNVLLVTGVPVQPPVGLELRPVAIAVSRAALKPKLVTPAALAVPVVCPVDRSLSVGPVQLAGSVQQASPP